MSPPLTDYIQQLRANLDGGFVVESDNAAGHPLPEPKRATRRDEDIIAQWLQSQQGALSTLADDDDSEHSFEIARWEGQKEFVSGPPQQPTRYLSSDSYDSMQFSFQEFPPSQLQRVGDINTRCLSPKTEEDQCPPRMPLRQGSFRDRRMGPVAA